MLSSLFLAFGFLFYPERDRSGFLLPAKAGLTGLDPCRFFTGTVGTLQKEEQRHHGFAKWDKNAPAWELQNVTLWRFLFLTETTYSY